MHRFIQMFFTLLLLVLGSLVVQAQQASKEGDHSWALGLQLGPYLPNQIPGVTEIQPTSLLRFSFPSGGGSSSEWMLSSSNANDVTIYNFSVSVKNETEIAGLYPQVYIGLDATSFRINPVADFETRAGAHLGVGLISHLGGKLYFRSDMKMNFSNPGTALQLGFGFEVRYPPGDASKESEAN